MRRLRKRIRVEGNVLWGIDTSYNIACADVRPERVPHLKEIMEDIRAFLCKCGDTVYSDNGPVTDEMLQAEIDNLERLYRSDNKELFQSTYGTIIS